MPLYTENNIGVDSGISLEDYRPTTAQALKSSWDAAIAANPTKTFESFEDLTGELPDFGGMSDADIVQFSQEETAAERMPLDEQAEYIKGSGLEGYLNPHASYTRGVLDTLISAKKEENWRNFVYDKSSMGQAALGFGAGLAGSLVDPINVASSFVIPGAPAKMVMQGLARASGPLARAGVRALEGAASGAIGAAAVEPLVYFGQQQLQADYDMYNSAMNLGFGAIMGGAIKPLAGAVGERFRKMRNQPQAWEYAPSTEETRALARTHEEALFNAQRQTDAGADPEKLRSAVADQAATYDAWMRHLSYKQQVPVADLYKRYQIDYYTGEIFDTRALQAGELVENYRSLQEEVAQVEERRNMLEQSGTLRVPDDGYDLAAAQARLEAMERHLPEALDLLRKQAAIRLADQASGTLSQPRLAGDSLSGEERLASEAEAWGKKVDEIAASAALPKQNVRMLSQTPLVMKLLDTDPNAPGTSAQGGIYASPHVFDKKHPNIGPNELKQLPQALADPIAIFDSATHKGDLVFMTEIKDKYGATVIVPIELKARHSSQSSRINRAKTTYAKDYALRLAENRGAILQPNNKWLLEQLNKNARYVNGRKLREWIEAAGVQFPIGVQRRILNSRELKVFTEADIVNLKIQNSTKYQFANTSPASRPNALGDNNVDVMGSSGADAPQSAAAAYVSTLESARAAVSFLSSHHAMVRFFKSADLTSAPHELYHIIQKQLEVEAMAPNAHPSLKAMWQAACDFVGAKPGQTWTVEQHEKFARAGERFLWEGKAPNAQLQPLFDRMRERLLEAYVDADSAGLEISEGMRKVFDDMLTVPVAAAEQRIQREIAKINGIEGEKQFYNPEDASNVGSSPHAGDFGADLDVMRRVMEMEEAEFDSALVTLEQSSVEEYAEICREFRQLLDADTYQVDKARRFGKVMEEFAACQNIRR